MDRPSDMDLVAALRAGDRDAFEAAYHRHKGGVLALAAAMLGSRDGVWDVLHDVFVGLARNAATLRPDSNLKGYLLTAAANRSRDRLSRRGRQTVNWDGVGPALPVSGDDPSDAAATKEEAEQLWGAVAELPPDQRVVVALHVYGGMTFKEIACSEGIPENTAQSRYRYAIEKLRRRYGGERQ